MVAHPPNPNVIMEYLQKRISGVRQTREKQWKELHLGTRGGLPSEGIYTRAPETHEIYYAHRREKTGVGVTQNSQVEFKRGECLSPPEDLEALQSHKHTTQQRTPQTPDTRW